MGGGTLPNANVLNKGWQGVPAVWLEAFKNKKTAAENKYVPTAGFTKLMLFFYQYLQDFTYIRTVEIPGGPEMIGSFRNILVTGAGNWVLKGNCI